MHCQQEIHDQCECELPLLAIIDPLADGTVFAISSQWVPDIKRLIDQQEGRI